MKNVGMIYLEREDDKILFDNIVDLTRRLVDTIDGRRNLCIALNITKNMLSNRASKAILMSFISEIEIHNFENDNYDWECFKEKVVGYFLSENTIVGIFSFGRLEKSKR